MARQAGIGELRTRIYIRKVDKAVDSEGVASRKEEKSVFAPGPDGGERVWHCKWVNAYGSEVFAAMQAQVQTPATLTMRYSPLIRPDHLIYRVGDPAPYEIISVNDVEDRHTWLEVKVKRKAAAR